MQHAFLRGSRPDLPTRFRGKRHPRSNQAVLQASFVPSAYPYSPGSQRIAIAGAQRLCRRYVRPSRMGWMEGDVNVGIWRSEASPTESASESRSNLAKIFNGFTAG